MKPALFSLFIAVKLVGFACLALAPVQEGGPRLARDPATLVAATEPLSGGYRRKKEQDGA